MPFPKVLHRSETGCQVKSHLFKILHNYLADFHHQRLKCMCHFEQVPHSLSKGKKSIFARQIAAQRAKEGTASLVPGMHPATVQKNDSCMEMDPCQATDNCEWPCLNVFVFTTVLPFVSFVITFFVSFCCLRATAGVWTGASGLW